MSNFSSIASSPIASEPCTTLSSGSTSFNSIANGSDCCTSPSTRYTLCTPLQPTLLVQNTKRLSINSDTSLVYYDHDDFMKDFCNADLQGKDSPEITATVPVATSANLAQKHSRWMTRVDLSVDAAPANNSRVKTLEDVCSHRHFTPRECFDSNDQRSRCSLLAESHLGLSPPRMKPPVTKRCQNLRPGKHRHEYRSTHLATVRDSIKRIHAKQLEHSTVIDHLETSSLPTKPPLSIAGQLPWRSSNDFYAVA